VRAPLQGACERPDGLASISDPHSTIELRLLKGRPFAAIHRYDFGSQQALTIHRLNDDMTSCVAAVVSVEYGLDANAEAARLAAAN
jgi:hypothetical protein